jgi:hypothetical protein
MFRKLFDLGRRALPSWHRLPSLRIFGPGRPLHVSGEHVRRAAWTSVTRRGDEGGWHYINNNIWWVITGRQGILNYLDNNFNAHEPNRTIGRESNC